MHVMEGKKQFGSDIFPQKTCFKNYNAIENE